MMFQSAIRKMSMMNIYYFIIIAILNYMINCAHTMLLLLFAAQCYNSSFVRRLR